MSDEKTRQADGLDEHFVALHSGFMLGKYELQAVLGQGGFGITYRAWDAALKRAVAIKEYLPSDVAVRVDGTTVRARSRNDQDSFQWGLERFLEEARALARFEEARAIVRVYDYMQANGTAYMVMALVEGTPLSVLYRREAPLSEERLKAIVLPILDGLEEVHRAGFLHRDIKPSNILIRSSGQPVLIDFGAARQALGEKSRSITSVFTPGYAPFEQYTSSGKQGPWTDIYALAATLYHGIAGQVPVQATDRIREDPLEPAAKIGAGRYSPDFLAAIDNGLEVFENRRPQSIAQWRDRLTGRATALPGTEVPTLDGQGQPTPASGPQDPQSRGSRREPAAGPASINLSAANAVPARRSGRTKAMVLALILVLVAAGGYAAWNVLDGSRAEEAKAAEQQRVRAEATARAQAEAQARAEAERLAREQEEAARRAEAARQRALEEERQRADADARLRAETEARIRAEYEAKAREEAEARRQAEEEARRKAAEEQRRRAEAETARLEAEAKKAAEAKARAEAEAKAKAEAEARARAEAERQRLAQQQAATQQAQRRPAPAAAPSPGGGSIIAPPSSAEIRAAPPAQTSAAQIQQGQTQQAAAPATPGFAQAGRWSWVVECPNVAISPFISTTIPISAGSFTSHFYRDGRVSGQITAASVVMQMNFTGRSGDAFMGNFRLSARGEDEYRGGGIVAGFTAGQSDRPCAVSLKRQ